MRLQNKSKSKDYAENLKEYRDLPTKEQDGIRRLCGKADLSYLSTQKEELINSLYQGKYSPNPLLRVAIPMDNSS